jgi:hypothetical protein
MQPDPHHCRSSLTERDWAFIAAALTGDESNRQGLRSLMEDADEFDAVLDHAKLLKAVLELPGVVSISPQLYFYTLVRHSMTEAGFHDRGVADYVAAVLAEVSRGNPFASRGEPPVDFTCHVDFLRVLDGATPRERFHLQVHCGNQFMVLTGLFPQFIVGRSSRRGAPGLSYYEGVARNAFRDAGDHPLAEHFAISDVYRQLADGFGRTRRILNRMASEYLFV